MEDANCSGCGIFMPGEGRYKYDKGMCRDCYLNKKKTSDNPPPPNETRVINGEKHWAKGVTMCIYCHQQLKTIRAMLLHKHMTKHNEMYQALSPEEKEQKLIERNKALANDYWIGDVWKNRL
jgi:hypothetical protein